MTGRNGHHDQGDSLVLGGVNTADLDGADHVEHARVLADIDRVRAQVDAAQIDVVVSALANSVHLEDGHRSVNHWIAGVLDASKTTAFAWKRRGELALRFPQFLDAFRDGRFTLDQYDAIARAYSNPRVRGAVGGFFDTFVSAARMLPFADFERLVGVFAQLADDSGLEPDHRIPTRGLNVRSRADGSCRINGFFGPEAAAVIGEILDRFLAEETRIDREAAAEIAAAGGSDELPRSLMERRADALVAALAQCVAKQPGRPAKPLTRLVLSWHAAQQLLSRTDPVAPVNPVDLLCRQMSGDPIDISAALAALIEGKVKVLVVDAMGRPCAESRLGSLFDDNDRQMLQALHPQCEWPGCPIHAPHLQADHITPRSRGGPTRMENAAVLCGLHNRWRHNHGYHVTRDPDGRLRTYRPDGTPLRPTA